MQTIDFKDQKNLNSLVTEEFTEWSEPLKVTQEMINTFADLSGDDLWIHVDEERCATESPFKSTIAHGFLIMCLLSKMPTGEDVTKTITGWRNIMNYGSDKLRFLNVVPVNSEIHARNRVIKIEVEEHKTKVLLEAQVKVVGQEKLALLYQLTLVLM
jgi:Acyl dehydratase